MQHEFHQTAFKARRGGPTSLCWPEGKNTPPAEHNYVPLTAPSPTFLDNVHVLSYTGTRISITNGHALAEF